MGPRLIALTDVGRKRKHNEDSVLGSPDLGLLLVADGMGGHLHGEVASRMALDTLVEHYQSRTRTVAPEKADPKEEEEFLRFAIEKANGAIFRKGDEDVNFNDMGTTIVALAVRPGYVVIGNVGDSRAYRLRGKRLRQLTRDHSWVGELWEKKLISKETAMIHPERNVVTRALGVETAVEVDVTRTSVREGDLFLLCTDGLTDLVSDGDIADVLVRHAEDLDASAKALVKLANERGGDDNVSVALALV